MSAFPPPIGNVCCVFTDIIDSTNLWAHNQRAMQSALTIHDALIRAELDRFKGYEVKALGDGFMLTFSAPESALQFCLSSQCKLQSVEWPKEIVDYSFQSAYWNGHQDWKPRGLQVRMGIHFGVPFMCSPNHLTGRMDYFGYMVSMAARIHGEADGDEIALSDEFLVGLYKQRAGVEILTSCLTHQLREEITGVELRSTQFAVKSKGLRPLKGVPCPQHVLLIVVRPRKEGS